MDTPTAPTPAAPPPVRRRWWRWLALILLVLLGLPAAWFGVSYWLMVRRLDAARAEADRLDPGWQWEQMRAAEQAEVIPEAENAAATVAAVTQRDANGNWRSLARNLTTSIGFGRPLPPTTTPPGFNLAPRLDEARAALATARRLADQPRGRLALTWEPDLISQIERLGKLEEMVDEA